VASETSDFNEARDDGDERKVQEGKYRDGV